MTDPETIAKIKARWEEMQSGAWVDIARKVETVPAKKIDWQHEINAAIRGTDESTEKWNEHLANEQMRERIRIREQAERDLEAILGLMPE